jgi:hypothetical protein
VASQWYLNDSGQEVGPLSSTELRRLARDGRIRPDSWLRRVGEGGWIPASRVKNLFEAPGQLPPPQPWVLGPTTPGAGPLPASEPLVAIPVNALALPAQPPLPVAQPACVPELEEVQPVSRRAGLGLWLGLGAGLCILAGGLLVVVLAVVYLYDPGSPSNNSPAHSRPSSTPLNPTPTKDVTFTKQDKK